MDKHNSAEQFVQGLKKSKDTYVECPHCKMIFSLYTAKMMYGKNPPKDLLAKSQKIVMKAQEKLENLQEQYDIAKDSWKYDLEAKNSDWRNKLDLKYQEFLRKEGLLKEKVRHMKQDVAATQKEIIKEKTQKALLSSRSAIEGHIAELFPLFKKTKINPADLCAMIPTQPVDYVVFDGLFQKDVKAVTFVDVKKGGSQLSHVQKTIKESIEDGHVDFKEIRVNFDKIKGNAVIK